MMTDEMMFPPDVPEYEECDHCGEFYEIDELEKDGSSYFCTACLVELAIMERGAE